MLNLTINTSEYGIEKITEKFKSKPIIEISAILESERRRRIFNEVDLFTIQFKLNGEEIFISDEIIEKWRFIGMDNVNFITTGFYKKTIDKV